MHQKWELLIKNKVTSYETSKALADAGFDSEAHCGWYNNTHWHPVTKELFWTWSEHKTWFDEHIHRGDIEPIKAYDCHDLICWLQYQGHYFISYQIASPHPSRGNRVIDPLVRKCFFEEERPSGMSRYTQPQEALAQAILEVLKND